MKTDLNRLAEDLFRRESARLVAQLTRAFGSEHLQLAEDVVQEAMGRALRTWPYYGVPDNPGAWLALTAKNLALDALRREQIVKRKQGDIFGSRHTWSSTVVESDLDAMDSDIDDALLRMMFLCCHPANSAESQLALTLKTLCGFGVVEIARALLSSEASIARRLTRAKATLRDPSITASMADLDSLDHRLQSVLTTLYLLFNEGYQASTGDKPLKINLCTEAVRLLDILVASKVGDKPKTHALLALMFFHQARLSSRVDEVGTLLLLRDQDRSTWDRSMIQRGSEELKKAASGGTVDRFHIEATIAAIHCTSPSYDETDWTQILGLYNILQNLNPTPVVKMNRAVAVGFAIGPKEALESLAEIECELKTSSLFHTVKADLHEKEGNQGDAKHHFRLAYELATTGWQRDLIAKRIDN